MKLTFRHDRGIATPIQMSSASAVNRFGKYKKEESAVIRQADISGDMLDELRRKREMLKSMTPEQAKQVIEFRKYYNVFEAISLAKTEGKLIAPNFVHDRILAETDDLRYLRTNYPALAGTLIIHEAPGKPFGKRISYEWNLDMFHRCETMISVSFDVPLRFRGEKDCALKIDYPDFDLVPSSDNAYALIADSSKIHLHKRFPSESGRFYRYQEKCRLPAEGALDSDCEPSRRLWRDDGCAIGVIVRHHDGIGGDNGRRAIHILNLGHSTRIALF